MMRYDLCTLFDSNYLIKGLTLYRSLARVCPSFTLWVLCMDDATYEILEEMKLQNARLIRRRDFEDPELLRVKPTRNVAEYCWTCTPSLPLYVLERDPSVGMIAYLDADLFFFSDPAPIYEELGRASITIIEHRFPENLKHLEKNGKYNVQMLVFRNDPEGIKCLRWWRDRCIEWCFFRLEDGKMGDQKYLDDWTERFSGVHVLGHKGTGLALWNITRYKLTERDGAVYVDGDPLIFHHFHHFDLMKKGPHDFGAVGDYTLPEEGARLVYAPYVKAVDETAEFVRKFRPGFDMGYKTVRKGSIRHRVMAAARDARGRLKR